MANTDKQNFRYNGARWAQAVARAQDMRDNGYDVDMTRVLGQRIDEFLQEPYEVTAERLGVEKQDRPVPRRYRSAATSSERISS